MLFLLPLVWMISAALRDPTLAPPRTVEWVPQAIEPGNLGAIFDILPFGRYLLNSLAVVAVAVPLTIHHRLDGRLRPLAACARAGARNWSSSRSRC